MFSRRTSSLGWNSPLLPKIFLPQLTRTNFLTISIHLTPEFAGTQYDQTRECIKFYTLITLNNDPYHQFHIEFPFRMTKLSRWYSVADLQSWGRLIVPHLRRLNFTADLKLSEDYFGPLIMASLLQITFRHLILNFDLFIVLGLHCSFTNPRFLIK